MTTQDVCSQLNVLFKADIQKKGLVSSGKLLKSIKWIYSDSNGFQMIAEDYFQYLDAKNNITIDVTNSKSFKDIMEKYFAEKIETEIINELKKN